MSTGSRKITQARALARGLAQINGMDVQQPENQSGVLQARRPGVTGRRHGSAPASARGAARDDGTAVSDACTPSRRHRRYARGDGRLVAAGLRGGVSFPMTKSSVSYKIQNVRGAKGADEFDQGLRILPIRGRKRKKKSLPARTRRRLGNQVTSSPVGAGVSEIE